MKTSDLMETCVQTCNPKTNLQVVAMQMWDNNCGSIVIIDEAGIPVGIITDRDIAMGAALNSKPLWEIMTEQVTNHRGVFTCGVDDDAQTALDIMEAKKIRRLPVVDETGQLKGVLSIDKLIRAAKPKGIRKSELSFDKVIASLQGICGSSLQGTDAA
jgi:CBS domain-containing protein